MAPPGLTPFAHPLAPERVARWPAAPAAAIIAR
jgi:hypothetical protein